LARKVLDYLPKERPFRGRLLIEEVSWDDPGAPTPLAAHLTPQVAIHRHRPKPSECDIVVVVLWSRMGTPLPEEYRKPNGTPYLSGTEWEFLDAIEAAQKQDGRPTVLVYRRKEVPNISLEDPEREERIRQYEAVKAFFATFRAPDGSLHRSYETYDSPSAFADRLERELRELIASRLEAESSKKPGARPFNESSVPLESDGSTEALWRGNPYRGLDPFREEDAPVFFGRGAETDALVSRIGSTDAPVIAVIGASGSGKSSLVGAGLLPRLAAGAFLGSVDWVAVRFTPAEAGDDPFRALAERLVPRMGKAAEMPADLAIRLRSEPSAIEGIAEKVLAGRPASAQLILFADQFEELFTARVAEHHRAPFIALVDTIAASHRVRLVLTLRADYYEHCTRFERLAERLRAGSFPLAVPGTCSLATMIERPARAAGLEPDPKLVDTILKETSTEPGALALMEFTLERLYDARAGHRLTLESYRTLQGVGGAIEVQGERAVRDAEGRVDEVALGRVFHALADVDETGGAVRKRARLDELVPAERALVERLVKARLLVTDRDAAGVPYVEVAHEAVLRHWPRFRDWLDANRDFILWRRRLRVWLEGGSLLRDAPLAEAKNWLAERSEELEDDEREFIGKSLAAMRRRKGVLWGSMASVLVLLSALSLWQYRELEAEWERRRPIFREEDWILIKPGQFDMGSPDADTEAAPDEKPPHPVRISKAFKLDRREVTFEEYDRFVYATGRRPPSDAGFGAGLSDEERRRLPVINVSYEDAVAYAEWLSEQTGKRFRLPREAEWEYAARAGTPYRRFWGDDPSQACKYANVFDKRNQKKLSARYGISWEPHDCEDPYPEFAPVGSFDPNSWGLYDMLGNVWEWVQDCYHNSYKGVPADGSAWEKEGCALRVFRGGSWYNRPEHVRTAFRDGDEPDFRNFDLGFRLAQDLD
jgi:formylglycine-generating enzyme required for sulfatase activity